MKPINLRLQGGFTLIELLVVVALIGIMSMFGIGTFLSYSKAQSVQQAAVDFANNLNTAKSKAYSQVNSCGAGHSLEGYNVTTAANSYTVNVVCSGVLPIPIISVSLASAKIAISPTQTVLFPVLTGGIVGVTAAGTPFTFTLGTIVKTITVNSAGVIKGP